MDGINIVASSVNISSVSQPKKARVPKETQPVANDSVNQVKQESMAKAKDSFYQAKEVANKITQVVKEEMKRDLAEEQKNVQGEAVEELQEKLQEAMDKLKDLVDIQGFKVQVDIDDRSQTIIASIVDKASGQVLKQLPPESILNLKAYIKAQVEGLFIDEAV